MLIADIAHGHVDAADVLFLIAAIVFVIDAVSPYVPTTATVKVRLVSVGLALVAVAWLLL